MSKQTLGLIGSVLLFVGVFTPIISLPIVGQQNLFQNGRGDGMVLIAIAAVSLIAVVTRRLRWLVLFGAVALGVIALEYVMIQSRISEMRAAMSRELAGNPFRGLGDVMFQAVQLQWGWAVLLTGGVCVLLAGIGPQDVPALSANGTQQRPDRSRATIATVFILLLVIRP